MSPTRILLADDNGALLPETLPELEEEFEIVGQQLVGKMLPMPVPFGKRQRRTLAGGNPHRTNCVGAVGKTC